MLLSGDKGAAEPAIGSKPIVAVASGSNAAKGKTPRNYGRCFGYWKTCFLCWFNALFVGFDMFYGLDICMVILNLDIWMVLR